MGSTAGALADAYAFVPGLIVNGSFEFNVTVPYTVEAGTVVPGVVTAVGAVLAETAMSVTFELDVALVAVTEDPDAAPVAKPVVNVPEYVPKAALTVLAAVMVAAVTPVLAIFANASAT